MGYEQQTFLGASIGRFDSSIRRGNGSAELNMTLYIDDENNDSTPSFVTGGTVIGQPVYFVYADTDNNTEFKFNGILRSWSEVASGSELYGYNLTISDCRDILEGVQIIVSDYAGTVAVSNIYNVYGYMESIAYGNSGTNEAGMPLYNVVNSLSTLTATTPLKFRGDAASPTVFNFGLDLTELPPISVNYRIAGPNITVLELIEQVCSDAGCDYYLDLVDDVIKLKIINRVNQTLSFSAINDFVTSYQGSISYTSGRELRNETTSKMIVGGPRIDVYFQEYNEGIDSLANIWPFWGFNSDGRAILGTGINDDHKFTVDSRFLDVFGIGETYTMDVAELRAANADKTSWENFLQIQNGIPGSVQYKRADNIGLVGGLSENILNLFQSGTLPTPTQMVSKTSKQIEKEKSAKLVDSNLIDESINRLYEFVKKYANEYYGRKFMVNLPFTISGGVRQDDVTGEYKLIQKPEQSGWIDESSSSLNNLIDTGYLPSDFNRYTTEDGRIRVMVAITNYFNYDFSDFDTESLIISGTNMFILADIEVGKIVTTGDGVPRAVITLPGQIYPRTQDGSSNLAGVLDDLLNLASQSNSSITEQDKKAYKSSPNLFTQSWEKGPAAVLPQLCIIPLQHSQNTYGPWYAAGASGKVDFEYATDLVPWNFGSEAAMDQIGNARVSNAITFAMEEESGTIVLPHPPVGNLGMQLVSGGPYVTDISVRFGNDGKPETTYNMKTWTPRSNQGVTKSQLDTNQKIAKSQQLSRRRLRDHIKINNVPKQFYQDRKDMLKSGRKNNTSNSVTTAKKSGKNYSNKTSKSEMSKVSTKDSDLVFDDDYQANAAMSIDGMEVAFSTSAFYGDGESNPAAFPYFDEIDTTDKPTDIVPFRDELDPFKGDHDIQILTTGTEIPEDGLTDTTSDEYRAIGHRAPMMVVGYGRDGNGFPVPNKWDDSDTPDSNDINSYADNHKQRRDIWKAGPLDLRFDDERGVWYSSPVKLQGYLTEDLEAYGSGNPPSGATALMDVWQMDTRNNIWQTTGTTVRVTSRDTSLTADSGVFIKVEKIGNEYSPYWVGC